MPTQLFTDGVEPEDSDTPILRFMERWKFEDLLTGRMYFRRADLFEDESEACHSTSIGRHSISIGWISTTSKSAISIWDSMPRSARVTSSPVGISGSKSKSGCGVDYR